MLEGLLFGAIALALWLEVIGPLAERLADRDVEGWGARR